VHFTLRSRGRGLRVILLLVFASSALAQTASPLPLRVGMSGDYRPFTSRAADGTLHGFEIVVAERLARDLGRRLEIVPFQWPNLIRDLQQGAFDIAMSGVTLRTDRALAVTFSRPYTAGGAVVVVRKVDAQRFHEADDVNRTGVRLAVNAGGHLERVARQRFAAAVILPTMDNTSLPALLRSTSVDAVVSDSFEAAAWAASDFLIRGPLTSDRKCYAMPRHATELAAQVDAWLRAREADGWLEAQRRRHLGAAVGWTAEQSAVEALVAAIDLRLRLMPYVAAIKRAARLPITDAAQERRVLERAGAAAAAAGLKPEPVVALFETLIAAAKNVEHAATEPVDPIVNDLDEMRAIIRRASDQLLAALHDLSSLPAAPQGAALRHPLEEALRAHRLPSELVDAVIARVDGVLRAKRSPADPG